MIIESIRTKPSFELGKRKTAETHGGRADVNRRILNDEMIIASNTTALISSPVLTFSFPMALRTLQTLTATLSAGAFPVAVLMASILTTLESAVGVDRGELLAESAMISAMASSIPASVSIMKRLQKLPQFYLFALNQIFAPLTSYWTIF